ncbi:hypothetical protein J2R96_002098 [Bradyrhizobium elkanii]|nr:hypothetical protein [Bradyrhizobium elkanii]
MADDDLVVANEDFLHEKAQHALAFDYIERADGRAEALEEARHGFDETQTNFLLLRLAFDRLQLQQVRGGDQGETSATIKVRLRRWGRTEGRA